MFSQMLISKSFVSTDFCKSPIKNIFKEFSFVKKELTKFELNCVFWPIKEKHFFISYLGVLGLELQFEFLTGLFKMFTHWIGDKKGRAMEW